MSITVQNVLSSLKSIGNVDAARSTGAGTAGASGRDGFTRGRALTAAGYSPNAANDGARVRSIQDFQGYMSQAAQRFGAIMDQSPATAAAEITAEIGKLVSGLETKITRQASPDDIKRRDFWRRLDSNWFVSRIPIVSGSVKFRADDLTKQYPLSASEHMATLIRETESLFQTSRDKFGALTGRYADMGILIEDLQRHRVDLNEQRIANAQELGVIVADLGQVKAALAKLSEQGHEANGGTLEGSAEHVAQAARDEAQLKDMELRLLAAREDVADRYSFFNDAVRGLDGAIPLYQEFRQSISDIIRSSQKELMSAALIIPRIQVAATSAAGAVDHAVGLTNLRTAMADLQNSTQGLMRYVGDLAATEQRVQQDLEQHWNALNQETLGKLKGDNAAAQAARDRATQQALAALENPKALINAPSYPMLIQEVSPATTNPLTLRMDTVARELIERNGARS